MNATNVMIVVVILLDIGLFWMMFRLAKLEAELFPPESEDLFVESLS